MGNRRRPGRHRLKYIRDKPAQGGIRGTGDHQVGNGALLGNGKMDDRLAIIGNPPVSFFVQFVFNIIQYRKNGMYKDRQFGYATGGAGILAGRVVAFQFCYLAIGIGLYTAGLTIWAVPAAFTRQRIMMIINNRFFDAVFIPFGRRPFFYALQRNFFKHALEPGRRIFVHRVAAGHHGIVVFVPVAALLKAIGVPGLPQT